MNNVERNPPNDDPQQESDYSKAELTGTAQESGSNTANAKEYEKGAYYYAGCAYEYLFAFARFIAGFLTNVALWTAGATFAIAIATVFYTDYAKKQWVVMSGQLELTDRPWINFDTAVDESLTFSGDQVYVSIRVSMRNSGPSPAMNVFISEGLAAAPTNIFEFRSKVCEDATHWSLTSPTVTETVFPRL